MKFQPSFSAIGATSAAQMTPSTQKIVDERSRREGESPAFESERVRERRGSFKRRVLAFFMTALFLAIPSDSKAGVERLVVELANVLRSDRALERSFVTPSAVRRFLYSHGGMVNIGAVRPSDIQQLPQMVSVLTGADAIGTQVTMARTLRRLEALRRSPVGEIMTLERSAFRGEGLSNLFEHMVNVEFRGLEGFLESRTRVSETLGSLGIRRAPGALDLHSGFSFDQREHYLHLALRHRADPSAHRSYAFAGEVIQALDSTYYPSFMRSSQHIEEVTGIQSRIALEVVANGHWSSLRDDPRHYAEAFEIFRRFTREEHSIASGDLVQLISKHTASGRAEIRFSAESLGVSIGSTDKLELWQAATELAFAETRASGRMSDLQMPEARARGGLLRAVSHTNGRELRIGPLRYNDSTLRFLNLLFDYEELLLRTL